MPKFSRKVNLIMPMAGKGSRFSGEGFDLPKPLIKIWDKPFFYWAARSVTKFVDTESIVFVTLEEHVDKFHIDKEILSYFPTAKIVVLPDTPNGAVLTSLQGVKAVKSDAPVLFNDCDHIFSCPDFYDFAQNIDEKVDGALITFESSDPKFSFCALDDEGNVTRTVEKEAISTDAICGAYYFKSRDVFEKSADVYLKECQYKEFFISGVYNVMAKAGKKIARFRSAWHIPFGTPEEYKIAVSSKAFGELM